jgi:hypothetical protein
MNGDATVSMALCHSLLPDEEVKARSLDGDVFTMLHQFGITDRPIWQSGLNNDNRVVQLYLPSIKSAVVEVRPSEFVDLTREQLLSLLESGMVRRAGNTPPLPQ